MAMNSVFADFAKRSPSLERAQHREEEDLALRRKRLQRAVEHVAAAEQERVFTEFERLSQLLYVRSQAIRDLEESLCAELIDYLHVAEDLQRIVGPLFQQIKVEAIARAKADPDPVRGNQRLSDAYRLSGQPDAADHGPIFSREQMMQAVALDLVVFTQGRFPFRYLTGDLHRPDSRSAD